MNSLEMSFVNKTTSKKGNDIFKRSVLIGYPSRKDGSSCPIGISRFDLAQTYKVRNSWTMSGMRSQIVAEKSQTKKT